MSSTREAVVATKHQLLDRLWEARRQTDDLFELVEPDSLYERPIAERHRIVFYIGHLEAFDWNLLRDRRLGLKPFNPEFDNLFAFGIDPVDGGLPSDQPGDWPSLEHVRRYVARVRARVDEGLAAIDLSDREPRVDTDASPHTLFNVALEHRLMHAETLAYMLHQLPYEQKISRVPRPTLVAPPIRSRMIEIPAGWATLGLSRDDASAFGWDNEYDAHTADVPAFAIENHKVTNRQYLAFVGAGGYEDPSYWSASGWEWKTTYDIRHPVFWQRTSKGWDYRTMFGKIPLPMDWPVYVSHAEASAYARWAGKCLPTETQWHRSACGTRGEQERPYPWGSEPPDSQKGNFDFRAWDPAPVGAFPEGRSAFEVYGLVGNGWEWTSSKFQPFDGFKSFSFYPGYSANFFDGQHYVLKGGSARTAGSMLRRSFRNWFQPHYQYVYAGFRCVTN